MISGIVIGLGLVEDCKGSPRESRLRTQPRLDTYHFSLTCNHLLLITACGRLFQPKLQGLDSPQPAIIIKRGLVGFLFQSRPIIMYVRIQWLKMKLDAPTIVIA